MYITKVYTVQRRKFESVVSLRRPYATQAQLHVQAWHSMQYITDADHSIALDLSLIHI